MNFCTSISKSKSWLLGVLFALLVLFTLHGLLIYFIYKSPEPWIYNVLTKKEQQAQKIQTPKILITGGSNVVFGVRSADIQKSLGVASVNIGANAGLEIDYILARAKRVLKSGDTVILPLEYEHFVKSDNLNQLRIAYILAYDKEYFHTLSFVEQLKYLYSISLDEFIMSLFKSNKEINYDSKTIDTNGDETANNNQAKIESFIHRKSHQQTVHLKPFEDSFGSRAIVNFALWCKKNNIKCYVSFASTIDFEIYHTKEYQQYFDRLVAYFRANNVDILGHPNDFLFDVKYFYDTNYHLNDKGMSIRTQKIIQMLQSQTKYNNK